MTTNLTKSISKTLLFAMLVVTIGAEILLYLSRYSTMASTLYDAVMVFLSAGSFIGDLEVRTIIRKVHASLRFNSLVPSCYSFSGVR
jgi:hypothetical protein